MGVTRAELETAGASPKSTDVLTVAVGKLPPGLSPHRTISATSFVRRATPPPVAFPGSLGSSGCWCPLQWSATAPRISASRSKDSVESFILPGSGLGTAPECGIWEGPAFSLNLPRADSGFSGQVWYRSGHLPRRTTSPAGGWRQNKQSGSRTSSALLVEWRAGDRTWSTTRRTAPATRCRVP